MHASSTVCCTACWPNAVLPVTVRRPRPGHDAIDRRGTASRPSRSRPTSCYSPRTTRARRRPSDVRVTAHTTAAARSRQRVRPPPDLRPPPSATTTVAADGNRGGPRRAGASGSLWVRPGRGFPLAGPSQSSDESSSSESEEHEYASMVTKRPDEVGYRSMSATAPRRTQDRRCRPTGRRVG